jgi:predicted glycogen debranching enzyme
VQSFATQEGLVSEQAEVQFGREICGDLAVAESREWLVTNGIGGYASGTIAGSQTRRYHGLLVAALNPPVGRTQLVSAIDEIVHYAAADFSLATHRWASGAVDPQGFLLIEDFHLEGSTPVWIYAFADALLEKRVWMRPGENTTCIQYTLVRGSSPLEMDLKALVNYRDFHSLTQAGGWRMKIEPVEQGVRVLAFDGAAPFYLKCTAGTCEPRHEWYLDCYYAAETERGLGDREDRLFAAVFRPRLEVGSSVTFLATTQAAALPDVETARAERANHDVKLFH